MKEHPIIFSTAMVKAILEGRKSQTRRIVKPQPIGEKVSQWYNENTGEITIAFRTEKTLNHTIHCSPYGQPGDVLYVRESHFRYGHWIKNGTTKKGKQKWKFIPATDLPSCRFMDNPPETIEKTTYRKIGWYKRPGIFLPKELTRIFLKVENVRVERLQEINGEGALSEGIGKEFMSGARSMTSCGIDYRAWVALQRHKFSELWDIINGSRAPWASNPWVWVIEFSRRE